MRILRSLFAFVVLPGVMAGIVPWLIIRGHSVSNGTAIAGLMVFVVGIVLLVLCAREFHIVGKGTLAPWDPPKTLVVTGPFAVVRNPMYIAVLAVVSGWALAFGSTAVVAYLLGLALAFNLRVILYEEPRIRKQFGAAWVVYRTHVRRWLPVPRRKHPGQDS